MVRPELIGWLRKFPHSFTTGPNALGSLKSDEYNFQEFPWRISYPFPVIKRTQLNWIDYEDPLCLLVKKKRKFQHELNAMQRIHKSNKKIKAFNMAFQKNFYSKNVVEFINKLDEDPDIYFTGNYDWNYTGGTMDIIRQSYFDYLLHVTGENLDQIEFQRISNKNKLKKSFEMDLSENGTIFEVIQSSQASNNFSVRHKFKNSIFNYQTTNSDKYLDKISEFTSKVPLISSAFDSFNNEMFCDLNVIGEFRAWDINTNSVIFEKNISPIECKTIIDCKGKWGALKNIERDVFLHCESKKINLFDLRTGNSHTKSDIFQFHQTTSSCEEISCITNSKINSNLMYIGTFHKLFGIDLRFVKKTELEMSSVIRWTHQLKSPPLMIKTDKNTQEEELILLSSPLVGDSKICVISRNAQMELISNYLPHKPYSIYNSFIEAQMKAGCCIDPFSMFKKRVRLCNMGISLICKEDRNLIFTQNSAGDVFQQFFGDKFTLQYDDVSLQLDDWMNETIGETTYNGHATEIIDLKSMLIPLMQRKCKDNETETFEGVETVKPKRYPKWQRSVNELHVYKDALASDLLSIWEFQPSTVIDEALGSMNQSRPTEKVNEWLNRRPSTDDNKMHLNLSLPVKLEETIDDDVDMIDSFNKTFAQGLESRPIKRKIVTKRKYVKGF